MLYLLTEFPADHGVVYVEALVKRILGPVYTGDWIEGFWENLGREVLSDIVTEYNRRLRLGVTLRFEPVDDVGTKIRGRPQPGDDALFEAFQSSLLNISDTEFEFLAARVLRSAGCDRVWATPQSHDQGLDAFGIMPFIHLPTAADAEESHPSVVMLAQAKHYHTSKVHTGDIRELVGSS